MKTNRRNFIRGAGAGVGLAATGGVAYKHPQLNPIGRASAIAPVVIGGAVVAGAALGYLTGEVADHYLGPDGGELTGAEEDQDLYTSLRTRMVEMDAANDSVLTTMSNRVEDSQNVAWPGAKKAVVNSFNNGDAQADAEAAGVAEIDGYYSTIQKNLLNRFTEVANKIADVAQLANSNTNVAPKFVINGSWGGTTSSGLGVVQSASYTTTLADGTAYAAKRYLIPSGHYPGGSELTFDAVNGVTSNADSYTLLRIDPWDTGTAVEPLDPPRWSGLWTAVTDAVTQMRDNIATYTTQLYQNYSPGEIDSSTFLDPVTLASELSTDYESTGYHAYAAAEAALLGVPGQMENALTIELMDSGITVNGSLWTDWNPGDSAGGSTTTTATNTTTTNTTTTNTTTSDTPTGFTTGTVYDPADTAKDVFLSYEYSGEKFIEGSDVFVKQDGSYVQDANVTTSASFESVEGETLQVGFTTLSEPFKIVSAVNTETGKEISTVTLESKNHQTAEVSLTEEQLQLLSDLRTELRENEATGGGGGGGSLFGGNDQPLILVAAGLAVAALLGGRR